MLAPSLSLRRARAHRGVVRGLDPRHRAYSRHDCARRRRRRNRRAVPRRKKKVGLEPFHRSRARLGGEHAPDLGLDAQASFRRRCYTLFTLQLTCVAAIQVYLLHTQAGRDLMLGTLRDNSFTLGVLATFMIAAVVPVSVSDVVILTAVARHGFVQSAPTKTGVPKRPGPHTHVPGPPTSPGPVHAYVGLEVGS